ncbi:dipeptidyl peptidase 4 [Pseudomassariella vexata]|uniref:Probable dipeptidyl-aminopeptidase B n=1 Tax=Pseudomassariella vexata TaxID=1141098 RepID=A0A1Y2EIG3_9PEZI|nr:dipeptidyl peptidase 4 [Pseudomassariella vexata]ORY71368.1 dipeptidyl peptidase 4 [Pseudomassariella vexata]
MKSSSTVLLAGATLLCVGLAISPPRQPHQPLGNGTRLLTFNETAVSSSFGASSASVNWLEGGEDGQVIYRDDEGALVLENFFTGENSTFVSADKIPSDVWDYWIRPDLEKVLFATNHTKQYRHSYFADYSVLDVASGKVTPLVEDQVGDIQYAEFAPVGDAIAFVRGNNLFLSRNGTVSHITTDGGPDLFHAVPDWVYEEEIFGARKTLWFSPDGEALAFLSFNETGVETFTVTYYMDGRPIAPSYPRELDLRYPKVGSTNPAVSLTLLTVQSGDLLPVALDAFGAEDLIIGEVTWLTDGHSSFVYRVFNRVQDQSKHVRVDVDKASYSAPQSTVIRERDGSDGWLDNNMAIKYIGAVNASGDWYIDLSDESGWQHLYLYSMDGNEGIPLTSGDWEVDSVLKVDTARQLIYYTSTEHDSTERHLYSVNYATLEKQALVDDTVPAYWSASFSSAGGYYILSYQGPDVPYQELYSINSSTTPLRTITSNEALWTKLQDYALPNITYLTLDKPDGFGLNVMQRLPPNFDPTKKYPVLFIPYGGPGAQEVSKRFQSLNWKAYITSDPELEFITYTVDGRGTGYRGREYRSAVALQLGKLETDDQLWAAQELTARNSFIDATKIGIFGWSFGGFLSAKVVEADSGIFSLGLIVAPVSDWRFYDSMYTERYMKTYDMNQAGYNETAVRKTQGFKDIAGGFTILHGLGDDNVHYQNTAALVDTLVGDGVSPIQMEWRSFTDSDHNINHNGALTYLYKYLTELVYREKLRTSETLTHQWSKKAI